MKIFNLFCFLGIIIFAVSCTGQKKAANNYLEKVNDTAIKDALVIAEPVIQKNDLLGINVYSASLNPAVDAPYNLPEKTAAGTGGASGGAGFLVDPLGNIDYPRLGALHVEGLTKSQLEALIKSKLQGQLTNPSVIIRFLNYKVTVLGEVRSPGSYTIPTERVSILEALGLAGDITEFGKRNTVKVLRESNGHREIATLDLTTKEMFTSPYYQLQQNDVIFVEQTSQRNKQRDQQMLVQQISLVTSIITGFALILNLIK